MPGINVDDDPFAAVSFPADDWLVINSGTHSGFSGSTEETADDALLAAEETVPNKPIFC